ncbi:S66 family peptidase [Tenuibacillus multivorans]|uniref:Muramoyltetrapeptide carboxypeptidase LdcA (Peptidoglycan recycling) n=1 Tax=Tenuibacillus multivorans TaxID=237069 RepID=A0A1H0A0E1_9BACI|nr:S66 peptidase family protein [Tenuibacillus multivorans]GEL76915.1 LD-carboxypeptidase [Tenuibacillus multivorans]SDN26837.1 Muramoyltetrapeptide carboxypeptidase LdcA (peptidoglycan recycling) [Tenuibacillus multivorans]
MIKYPFLKEKATIGVTAPSSGVPKELHTILKDACNQMESKGFHVTCGDTVWTQGKAKSAPAKVRAEEFNQMMQNPDIDIIIPPWGGELLIETLEHIDFNQIQNKWILGYSDVSLLLLAITLQTGIATAHGTNLVNLRGEYSDETTAMWQSVLSTKKGESILQRSSEKFQKEWQFGNPTPHIFHLTEATEWKTTSNQRVTFQGRLLGGCIDTVHHLVGTPFGNVESFRKNYLNENESIIWFFENCELTTTDLRRSLVQMKLAGWFDHCSGILFGRSEANTTVDGYTAEDIYQELENDLGVPIIYDIDCGHQPPQITLINGAYAEVETHDNKGSVLQYFYE